MAIAAAVMLFKGRRGAVKVRAVICFFCISPAMPISTA